MSKIIEDITCDLLHADKCELWFVDLTDESASNFPNNKPLECLLFKCLILSICKCQTEIKINGIKYQQLLVNLQFDQIHYLHYYFWVVLQWSAFVKKKNRRSVENFNIFTRQCQQELKQQLSSVCVKFLTFHWVKLVFWR